MAEPEGPRPALVAALREEVTPLLARCRIEARLAVDSGRFYRGRLVCSNSVDSGHESSVPVVIGWTGDGAVQAARGLAALADRVALSQLIGLGICGGLAPNLAVGQLIVAQNVCDETGAVPAPDAALTAQALQVPGTVPGILWSTSHIVASAAGKTDLWRALDAPPAAGVDLESAAWARTAAARNLPYVVIRAVSDPAAEDLPLDFSCFQAADGSVRRATVVRHALCHPTRLPALWGLRNRLAHCAAQLAACVQTMLEGPALRAR